MIHISTYSYQPTCIINTGFPLVIGIMKYLTLRMNIFLSIKRFFLRVLKNCNMQMRGITCATQVLPRSLSNQNFDRNIMQANLKICFPLGPYQLGSQNFLSFYQSFFHPSPWLALRGCVLCYTKSAPLSNLFPDYN